MFQSVIPLYDIFRCDICDIYDICSDCISQQDNQDNQESKVFFSTNPADYVNYLKSEGFYC